MSFSRWGEQGLLSSCSAWVSPYTCSLVTEHGLQRACASAVAAPGLAQWLWRRGLVALACGTFPRPGMDPVFPALDSLPVSPQGSLVLPFFFFFFLRFILETFNISFSY